MLLVYYVKTEVRCQLAEMSITNQLYVTRQTRDLISIVPRLLAAVTYVT